MDILLNWLNEHFVEVIAAISGIIGVWLTTRQNIWCWPVALVNVILYIYVFFAAKLYADFGLQIFYFVMTLYGWYNWLHGGDQHQKLEVVTHITKKLLIISLIIGIISQTALGFILANYSDAALPFWDSVVGVWGVIITYWMAKKILENWIAWIIIDLMCVGIYLYKDLYPTTVLYFVFAVLAVVGYFQWNKFIPKNVAA